MHEFVREEKKQKKKTNKKRSLVCYVTQRMHMLSPLPDLIPCVHFSLFLLSLLPTADAFFPLLLFVSCWLTLYTFVLCLLSYFFYSLTLTLYVCLVSSTLVLSWVPFRHIHRPVDSTSSSPPLTFFA
ncbi:hypothetical protein BKA57DRAFT_467049 [Linnemannia elongata]|nr:hypothetical protein BKA57DRAFT_467049 [Linnemannia elongata]